MALSVGPLGSPSKHKSMTPPEERILLELRLSYAQYVDFMGRCALAWDDQHNSGGVR